MVPSQELSSRLVLLLTFFLSLVGDAFATASLTQRSSSPSSCGTNGQSFPCEIAPAFVYPVHDLTRSSRCEPWENAVSAPECSIIENEEVHPGVATFISGQSWVRRTRLSDNSTLRTVRSASTTGQWDVEILGDLVKTYLEEGRTRVQTTMSSLTQSTQQWLTASELRASELKVVSEQAIVWWEKSEYSSPIFWESLYSKSRDAMSERVQKVLHHSHGLLSNFSPSVHGISNYGQSSAAATPAGICTYYSALTLPLDETCSIANS